MRPHGVVLGHIHLNFTSDHDIHDNYGVDINTAGEAGAKSGMPSSKWTDVRVTNEGKSIAKRYLVDVNKVMCFYPDVGFN
jgi:hypothetical protein